MDGCFRGLWLCNQAAFADGSIRQVPTARTGPNDPAEDAASSVAWRSSDEASPGAAASVKRAHAAPGPRGVWGRRGPMKKRRGALSV